MYIPASSKWPFVHPNGGHLLNNLKRSLSPPKKNVTRKNLLLMLFLIYSIVIYLVLKPYWSPQKKGLVWLQPSTDGIIAKGWYLWVPEVASFTTWECLNSGRNNAAQPGFVKRFESKRWAVCVIIHQKTPSNIRKSLWSSFGNTSEVLFLLFFHQVNFTCPNLFRPLTWKRSYISDFSNQSRLQEFEFLLQHPIHPWVKATLLDALQLWRDQHADVREASWRNTSSMQTWGKCELCCLESPLSSHIRRGGVCMHILTLFGRLLPMQVHIHILCVWEYYSNAKCS